MKDLVPFWCIGALVAKKTICSPRYLPKVSLQGLREKYHREWK